MLNLIFQKRKTTMPVYGTSFDLDNYDDLVDGWLEEKYND